MDLIIRDKISKTREDLTNVHEQNQLADFVYVADERYLRNLDENLRQIFAQIYLPDYILYLTTPSEEEPYQSFLEANNLEDTFMTQWQIVSELGYTRLLDQEPLSILEYAKVWLYNQLFLYNAETRQIEENYISAIGSQFAQAQSPEMDEYLQINKEQAKILFDVIEEIIRPVLDEYITNDIHFIRRNFLLEVLNFNSIIDRGLKAQALTINGLFVIQEEILPFEGQPAYDLSMDRATYAVDIAYKNDNNSMSYVINIEQDLYDDIKVDEYIPLCILNKDEIHTVAKKGSTKRWLKTHCKNKNDINDVSYKPSKKREKDKWAADDKALSLILYVYAGNGKPNMSKQKDYVRVVYSFRKGSRSFNKFKFTLYDNMLANISLEEQLTIVNRVIQRINNAMHNFKLISADDIKTLTSKVRQQFIVPDFQIDRDLLMFMLSTSVAGSILLRYPEQDKTWTQRLLLRWVMFLFGNITILISTEEVKSKTTIVYNKGYPVSLFEGDKRLTITITSKTLLQADIAKFVVVRLLQKYNESYQELYKLYNVISNDRVRLEPVVKITRERVTKFDPDSPVAKQLAQVDPLMWKGSDYARKITPRRELQVMPIREDQVEYYKNLGRDVIKWPTQIRDVPPEMQIKARYDQDGNIVQNYYTASSDTHRFIAFVRNRAKKTDEYPLMPKCQKDPSGITIFDDWSIALNKVEHERVSDVITSVNRLLKPRQKRKGGADLAAFFDLPEASMVGMPRSKSSLLTCVLFALDASFREKSIEDMLDTTLEIRPLLADFAVSCKQENPEVSVDKIAQALLDPNVYLDPSLYYRAVEELLQCNIFVLNVDKSKRYILEPPNYIAPYVRLKSKYESTVLIFKFVPELKEFDITPQCEIVSSILQGQTTYAFSGPITEKLSTIINLLTQSITIKPFNSFTDGNTSTKYAINVSTRRILELPTNKTPIGQSIDAYGKTRSLTYEVGDEKITLVTEPLEPQQLPIIEPVYCTLAIFDLFKENMTLDNISYTPYERKLVGIWCTLNNIKCYVPLEPQPWLPALKPIKMEIGYYVQKLESATQSLLRLQKVVTILIQLIKRMYVFANNEDSVSVEEFMAAHTIIKVGHFYDVTHGKRSIPDDIVIDLQSAKEYFTELFPLLFENGRIILDSQQLKDNLTIRLKRYQKIRDDQSIVSKSSARVDDFPPFLTQIYETPDDFTRYTPYQMTFTSYERFLLEKQILNEEAYEIHQNISISLKSRKAPYFYLHKGMLFAVQNVYLGQKTRAVAAVKIWKRTKINSGYYAPEALDTSSILEIDYINFDIKNADDDMILYYGNEIYAALLKIN